MRYKGVLFDLDGTILDTSAMIVKSFQHTFRVHCGVELSLERMRGLLGKTMVEAMQILAPEQDPDVLIATYRAHQVATDDDMKIFPGVQETLEVVAGLGLKMAIVTSRRRETAIAGLKKFGIDHHFPVVIGTYECEKHKPDPEPINKALALLGLRPEDCIMIGDSTADIGAAHNAGMAAAVVSWSCMEWQVLAVEKPEYRLEHMMDLIDIIKS